MQYFLDDFGIFEILSKSGPVDLPTITKVLQRIQERYGIIFNKYHFFISENLTILFVSKFSESPRHIFVFVYVCLQKMNIYIYIYIYIYEQGVVVLAFVYAEKNRENVQPCGEFRVYREKAQ